VLAEERRVKEAGVRVIGGRVSGKLAVTRAIGDFDFKGKSTEQKD
jgi:hypothetical protein